VANDSTLFYFITNKDAPQNKIITIDIADPKFKQKDLIPEDQNANLETALAVADKYLVVLYKRNVS
jgi:prolyl oligopeptidase